MKFSRAFSIIKNKYLLAMVLFLVWMLFFDPKDWGLIMERRQKLENLQKSETHLTSLIQETKEELNLLKTNAQTLEQYAREQYYMKKDNEDLYIVNPAINK